MTDTADDLRATSDAVDETPRAIADILADWRAAERRAGAAVPGSTEALEAENQTEHFRHEYRRAHEAHRA